LEVACGVPPPICLWVVGAGRRELGGGGWVVGCRVGWGAGV